MLGPRRTASRLLWSWALGRLSSSDASGTITKVQGQFNGDRLIDKAKLVQQFGFASRPPQDTDLVAICPSGEPTSALVIATNSQAHRPPPLEEGDGALYDQRGAYVRLNADGLQIEAKGQPVTITGATRITITDATTIEFSGATTMTVSASESVRLNTPLLEVTGDVVSSSGSI